jgi:hypothetical protein
MPANECTICLKNVYHGGKCNGKHSATPCLLFENDPRGHRVYDDSWLNVDFGREIPVPGGQTEATVRGVDKTLNISKIVKVRWNHSKKTGALLGIDVYIKFWYWSDENGVITKMPNLKIVK